MKTNSIVVLLPNVLFPASVPVLSQARIPLSSADEVTRKDPRAHAVPKRLVLFVSLSPVSITLDAFLWLFIEMLHYLCICMGALPDALLPVHNRTLCEHHSRVHGQRSQPASLSWLHNSISDHHHSNAPMVPISRALLILAWLVRK